MLLAATALLLAPSAGAFAYEATLSVPASSAPSSNYVYRLNVSATAFNFSQTLPNATDLRIYDSLGNQLDTWVYLWNHSLGNSTIFVEIPYAPADAFNLTMRWGNASMTTAATSCRDFAPDRFVCDTSDGYQPPYVSQRGCGSLTRTNGYTVFNSGTWPGCAFEGFTFDLATGNWSTTYHEVGLLSWSPNGAGGWGGIQGRGNCQAYSSDAYIVSTHTVYDTTDLAAIQQKWGTGTTSNGPSYWVSPPKSPTLVRDLRGFTYGSGDNNGRYSMWYDGGPTGNISVGPLGTTHTCIGVKNQGGNIVHWDNLFARRIPLTGDREINLSAATPTPAGPPPVLVGRGFREQAFLNWDSIGWTSPISYGLYRGSSPTTLALYKTFSASEHAYSEPMTPGQAWYYAIRVSNASGTSPYSDVVLVSYTPPPPPLYGDNGIVYGGDKAALAAQYQISPTSLGIMYGLIYVLGFTSVGYGLGRSAMTAGLGAGAGVIVAMVLDFFPVWLVAFIAIPSAAAFFLLRRARGGAG